MRSIAKGLLLLFVLAVSLIAPSARAHGMRTAYVELREIDHRVLVQVRSGATFGGIRVVAPDGCVQDADNWTCTRPLRGATVKVDGLGGVVADAVVVAIPRDGETFTQLLRPGAAEWTVPNEASVIPTVIRFVRAGFFHVLAGADHLLFLAALVVALRRFRAVLVAETAFTLSHSIAFTATSLGWIQLPSAATEAAIALSLVLLALDVARRPMPAGAGARMALFFGAVHGLGFAGGLAELGVPREAALPALVGFAGGVEIAQVAFLLVVFAVWRIGVRFAVHRFVRAATTYAVGITGTFWLLDRAVPIFGALH